MAVPLNVKDIMAKPVTIAKSQSITEALDKMLHEGTDPLIVMSSHQVVGTVSRKSIAAKLGSKQKSQIATAKIHIASTLEEHVTAVSPDQEITTLVPLIKQNKLIIVFDRDHNLVGQVGYGELLKFMQPRAGIGNAMEPARTIEAGERLTHLQNQITEFNITHFVVTEKGKITGIVTETDIAVSLRKFRERIEDRHQDFHLHNLLVRAVMTSPVLTADLSAKVPGIIDLMLKKKISSLPITDKGRLIGMVTRQSLINAL